MTLRSLAEKTRRIVADTLTAVADEPEVDRLLVSDAVIAQEGDRFRIESGEETWDELSAQAQRSEGLCDCGATLSSHGDRWHCRTCGREFPS